MIKDILINTARIFSSTNFITNPMLEAKILLTNVLACSVTELSLLGDKLLTSKQEQNLAIAIDKRLRGTPIAYIIGKQEFWKYEFIVSPDTLIPRPDSETLIEAVLSANQNENTDILELGVGSGCLIISLLLERNLWRGIGVDISLGALDIANRNLENYRLQNRLNLLHSNWFSALNEQKFDIIIANPPYIAAAELNLMAKETLEFEPHQALFAENNGLAAYYEIANGAKNFLKPNGKIYLEIGFSQYNFVKDIFESLGYSHKKSYKDLHNIIRCLEFF